MMPTTVQRRTQARTDHVLAALRQASRRSTATTAAEIASSMRTSPRTVYRLVGHLRRQGFSIRGEAGAGYQLLAEHSRSFSESITWHPASAPPDADLTVLVETRNCSEPVWLGFYNGAGQWYDTENTAITVVRWADLPRGGEAAC